MCLKCAYVCIVMIGERNTKGQPKDLVLHVQNKDGVRFHALCGRRNVSIGEASYFEFYGHGDMCRACLKKLNSK